MNSVQNNYRFSNTIKIYSFSSKNEIVEYIGKEKKILIAINAEKILHADVEIKEIINQNIGYSDGIGAVWALKKKGLKDAIKIPGCELWLDIIKSAYKDKTFYLIGSKQVVIEATVSKLKQEYPGITIANYRNGYIKTEDEKQILLDDIKAKKPDVVFVAMGSPIQELLMQEMQEIHQAVYQGLGGSFDVYTGHVKRAPQWWIRNNLEWAYRLLKQPTRIKRQLHLLRFFWLLTFNKI